MALPSEKPLSTSPLLSLSSEIQEEILSRTPADALLRSRPMCKRWTGLINTLTADKTFISKHLDHSSSRFIRTVNTVNVADPVTQTLSTSPVPDEFQDPNKIETLLHCDGLMLCRRRGFHVKRFEPEDPRRPQLAIWNPVLRKVKWIKPSHCVSRYNSFGLGYKNRGDYMILRVPHIGFKFVDGANPVEIYELKNESWRTLENVKVDWVVDSSCQGVSVMGNMYWLAKSKMHKSYILGFSFTVEAFKDICSSPCGGDPLLSSYSNSRLSLLQQERSSRKIDVWVSNDLTDESVLFAKHFSVASPDLPVLKPHVYTSYPVYCFVKPKSIVAWCEGEEKQGDRFCSYCTLYEIGEGGLGNTTVTERHYNEQLSLPDFCGHVYVPSLVPL